MIALIVGGILAIAALAFVLYPLFARSSDARADPWSYPLGPPLTPERERALAALQEIEFEHATGKLSDGDYARLRREHAWAAAPEAGAPSADAPQPPAHPAGGDAVEEFIRAYRARQAVCPVCGPRPEPDARHCSSCGRPLGSACPRCGVRADPAARFCASCGGELAR